MKDQYGKNSEVVKAFVKEIMDLPHITGANPKKIAEFSENLNYSVQALETLNKLKDVQGNVSMTLDKLPAIRGDLVRNDPDWESWDFAKLSEAVRQWTKRNPVYEKESDSPSGKFGECSKVYQAKATKVCVYCDGEHKAGECEVVTSVNKRREILEKGNSASIVQQDNIVQMLVSVNQHAESVTSVTIQVYVMPRIEIKRMVPKLTRQR